MAPEKKNDFLDADDSDDDQSIGYDSEADEIQKGRSAKRRRVDEDEDVDDDVSDNDDGASDEEVADAKDDTEDAPADGSKSAASDTKAKAKASDIPDITKTLTKKNLIKTEAAIRRSGVVYLSRIPPYMKPHKLRSLLSPHGTINRIFLAPEDPAAHTRRVKSGGNKKRLYTEGWVEFTSKKDARRTCEMLNARTIGGKKGSYYRDDIWNLLYLKGFKWNNLTEQIASENAERASRMRAEISKTTRENKEFVRNVERSKVLEGVKATQEKKRKREEKSDGAEAAPAPAAEEKADGRRERMSFKQVALAPRGGDKKDQPEHVTRVLSKIF
ncbi:pre-rRNA-processing protein ESF2 [Plectosphaerella cucumerina]|uniref:18S rRNA factor 2 n=1 Tax=Plectosphaerella cucumerina TaxID=40658 RepID=A0A8K0X9A3_9PEZI|nr:pre-rRNA-processing protein ESF2 [Plectosphaerella cucumerina]